LGTMIDNSDTASGSGARVSGAGDAPNCQLPNNSAAALPRQPEAVRVLTALLRGEPKPEEISIAILRADGTDDYLNNGDGGNDSGDCGGDTGAAGAEAATYPTNAFKKVDTHLGMHAPDLPRLARDFRDDYYNVRKLFRRTSISIKGQHRLGGQNHCINSFGADDGGPTTSRVAVLSFGGASDDTSNSSASICGNAVDSMLLRQRIVDATSCLLLTCPDNATAWADRRRALLLALGNEEGHMPSEKFENIFITELKFVDLLFTQHSKAPNAWAHRKWICSRIVCEKISRDTGTNTAEKELQLLQPWAEGEIDLCTRVAEHFPKNYFSWAHRYYAISVLFSHWPNAGKSYLSDASLVESLGAFLAGEVMFIEQWLSRHVSDHSAAHYGAEALRLHLKHGFRSGAGAHREESGTATEWALAVVKGVLTTSKQLIQRYSSHEVIWIWRRHVGQVFLDIVGGEFDTETLMAGKAVEVLGIFLEAHVYEVYDYLMNGRKLSNYNTNIRPEEEEVRLSRIHGLTYLLWILDQLQRRNTLIDFVPDKERLNTIRNACKDTLAKDVKVCYNTWRFEKVSEDQL